MRKTFSLRKQMYRISTLQIVYRMLTRWQNCFVNVNGGFRNEWCTALYIITEVAIFYLKEKNDFS